MYYWLCANAHIASSRILSPFERASERASERCNLICQLAHRVHLLACLLMCPLKQPQKSNKIQPSCSKSQIEITTIQHRVRKSTRKQAKCRFSLVQTRADVAVKVRKVSTKTNKRKAPFLAPFRFHVHLRPASIENSSAAPDYKHK